METLKKGIEKLSLNKIEKQLLDRTMRPLKDLIAEKKEKALLDLPGDKLQLLEQMKKVLSQKKQRKKEIKGQLETYRNALEGGSGFDFEKAMMYRELIDTEKERLKEVDTSIVQIEDKIANLEESS